MAVWCNGVVDARAAQSVDMMDNARRYPHAHSRKATAEGSSAA